MLTSRELATVLAALRCRQRDLESEDEIVDGGEHFADHLPLSAAEIDELCDRLNGAAWKPFQCWALCHTACQFSRELLTSLFSET